MTRTTSKPSKKESILNAAEELFALHGYDGVTIRQIANKANVDVALASYHFGKKLDLFETVFFRRAKILNDVRLKALKECEKKAGPDGPNVESIVEAFLRPLASIPDDDQDGWKNYYALVAYINSSPTWGKLLMNKHFDPLVSHFINALRKALKGISESDLYWGYHYMSGALTLTLAQTERIDRLSNNLCKSSDLEAAYDRMIPFITAGFKKL